ncbi:unnamed protein product [Anisakis simplex]|uniref:inositol-phosphate phosphatase n=1 Tax=Anisakis simplex TaxID=6269 RepID=A0A0M3JYV0_ANISI|nr:unnamed protein product [Anisakis simplex]
MQIRPNIKNLTVFCIFCIFSFIGYVILSSDQHFPDVAIELRDVLSYAILAVEIGGRAIVKINEENALGVLSKGKTAEGKDELLTKADLVSNYLILDTFRRFPGIQVVSEETDSQLTDADVEKYRVDNYEVWLAVREVIDKLPSKKVKLSKLSIWVDPLDATQEFSEGLLDYVTVMVCIAFDGKPIFGAIYRPFSNETVFGLDKYGVIKGDGKKWEPTILNDVPKKILISRSHAGAVEDLINNTFGDEYTVEPVGGSGYKTLRIINGTAQIYLHRTAIKKWDICAGNALVNAINGSMIDLNGDSIDYRHTSDHKIEQVQLNELAIAKLRITSEFIALNYELEKALDTFRFNLSRTKSIVGISNVSASIIDYREMEPTVRVDVNSDGNFTLASNVASENDTKPIESFMRKRGGADKSTSDSKNDNGSEHANENGKSSGLRSTSSKHFQFRPFGVLEPTSAKMARSDMKRSIDLICQIASVKNRLLSIAKQYNALRNDLSETQLSDKLQKTCEINA